MKQFIMHVAFIVVYTSLLLTAVAYAQPIPQLPQPEGFCRIDSISDGRLVSSTTGKMEARDPAVITVTSNIDNGYRVTSTMIVARVPTNLLKISQVARVVQGVNVGQSSRDNDSTSVSIVLNSKGTSVIEIDSTIETVDRKPLPPGNYEITFSVLCTKI